MPFLGQGLQRTPRNPTGLLRCIGMHVISATGAFSWTVPSYAEYCDIIAVAASPGTGNGGGGTASGCICQRLLKPVYPGLVITGSVGATTPAVKDSTWGLTAGSTTVDGMTAPGATTAQPAYFATQPTGGDINLLGIVGDNMPLPSLASGLTAATGPQINDPTAKGLGAAYPGGGAGVSQAGQNGGVFFIMYRSM